MMRRLMPILAVTLLAGGCATVGPDYKAPDTSVSGAFVEQVAAAPDAAVADLAQWWRTFGDSDLDQLVDIAIANNKDLAIAEERIVEARAGVRSSLFDYVLPRPDVSARYARERASGGIGQESGSGGTAAAGGVHSNLWQAGFDATWEIDVFGGKRRALEASRANEEALLAARRDTIVTLLGDVARNYIEFRSAAKQVAIAQKNLDQQLQTLELTRTRAEAGLGTELDVARARAQAESTRSRIPLFQARARAAAYRLDTLLGGMPGQYSSTLGTSADIPVAKAALGLGVPADLLARRPDIRQREREIQQATARVGVETAELFPKFTLTGSAGLAASQDDDLFEYSSRTWSIAPGIRWRILDYPLIKSNIDQLNSRQRQSLLGYEQTVLRALEETDAAIASWRLENERTVALAAAVESNTRAVELSNALFREGLEDFLTVLDAEDDLRNAESALAESEANAASNLVAVYKALGGGWENFEGEPVIVDAPAADAPSGS